MIPFLRDNSVVFLGLLSWFIAQLIKFIIEVSTTAGSIGGAFLNPGECPALIRRSCAPSPWASASGRLRVQLFALAFMIAMVVMYDAMGVRRAAGEQAEAINELREKISEDQVEEDPFPEWGKPLREALGHKPTEVISGAILGIAVSFLAF